MRAAMSLRVFAPGEGENPGAGGGARGVRHNAVSGALQTTLAHDAVGFALEEYGPAALRYVESLRRFPASSARPDKTALALANGFAGTGGDTFSAIAGELARIERFANAMSWVMTLPENSADHFVSNVPWSPS